jgi:hypothetical protein
MASAAIGPRVRLHHSPRPSASSSIDAHRLSLSRRARKPISLRYPMPEKNRHDQSAYNELILNDKNFHDCGLRILTTGQGRREEGPGESGEGPGVG